MDTILIRIWFLVPLTALIASAIAVRHPAGRVRTGAMIALGVAAIQGIATWSVSSTPDGDAAILLVASALSAFAGFFHRELTGTTQRWVRKHAMWIWGGGIFFATVIFAPQIAQALFALAVVVYALKIMIFGLRKKLDGKSH